MTLDDLSLSKSDVRFDSVSKVHRFFDKIRERLTHENDPEFSFFVT